MTPVIVATAVGVWSPALSTLLNGDGPDTLIVKLVSSSPVAFLTRIIVPVFLSFSNVHTTCLLTWF